MMFSSGVVKLLSQSVEDRARVEMAEKKYQGLQGVKDRFSLSTVPINTRVKADLQALKILFS